LGGAVSPAVAAVPQPAISACNGKASGASCSFQTPTGNESGSCQTVESQFACVPATGGAVTDTPSGVSGTVIGEAGSVLPDTGQTTCYDTAGAAENCPASGSAAYGQDAQYAGRAPSYTDNGDGTVTDNVTGLMWQQDPDMNGDGKINVSDMRSFADARTGAATYRLAGYADWRLPTIKELYSLIDFSGSSGTAQPNSSSVPSDAVPYIDTDYFRFSYGDLDAGLRYIDAQYWSSTEYVGTTMAGVTSASGDATAFGVNFADGRIKGYGTAYRQVNDMRFVRYVRGGSGYGTNHYADNGDGTISDSSNGLMWLQNDSGHFRAGSRGDGSVNWSDALAWCEGLSYAGHSDWRLPNAKELQSLVDYTRAPAVSGSAAIDPLFATTSITDEGGSTNYPFYWTSTTHRDGQDFAVYIAFGQALGCMNGVVTDVHGAGAQRSDPKTDSGTTLGCGNGPQGDVIRVYNYARCVRDTTASTGVAASYAAEVLTLPGIDGGTAGKFQASLRRLSTSSSWLFEVVSLTSLSASAATAASFDMASGVLTIPSLSVGSSRYAVTLTWQRAQSGLVFELTSATVAD
jgi:hypothetical protein